MKFEFKCKDCREIFPSNIEAEECILCGSKSVFKYFGNANPIIADERLNSNIEGRLYAHKKYLQDQIRDMKDKAGEMIP